MTTDTIGGVWTYALELCRELSKQGVAVILASMGAPVRPSMRSEAARIPGLRLEESHFALEWMNEPWDDVRKAGDWLLKLEERTRPDVIHLNGYTHATLPWKAPVVVVAHSCVMTWWRAVRGHAAPEAWQHYGQRVRAGLNAADLVVAPSQAMMDALMAEHGPFGNALVIKNGRAPYSPDAERPRKDFILSVGRLWDEAKNLKALQSVAADLPWRVAIAGEWQRAGEERNPPEEVECLGQCSQSVLGELYASASIYASPAFYEPFGLAALEAAQAGCPLVLGAIPSLSEIWGDSAIYVPPWDTNALRDVLLRLISNKHYREEAGAAARERAKAYHADRMGTEYLGAYRELTSNEKKQLQPEEVIAL